MNNRRAVWMVCLLLLSSYSHGQSQQLLGDLSIYSTGCELSALGSTNALMTLIPLPYDVAFQVLRNPSLVEFGFPDYVADQWKVALAATGDGHLFGDGWWTCSGAKEWNGAQWRLVGPGHQYGCQYMIGGYSDERDNNLDFTFLAQGNGSNMSLFGGISYDNRFVWKVGGTGALFWGNGGPGDYDTSLGRARPGVLSTPGSLSVEGGIVLPKSAGIVTLNGGSATISTELARPECLVFLTRRLARGATGELTYAIPAAGTLEVHSQADGDNSDVNWLIINSPAP
jgi:hypothetical protein